MEFGRFQQIEDLKAKGWYSDSECEGLAIAADEPEPVCGGPTYMKAPNGLVYEVGCGTERPLEGFHLRRIKGALTTGCYMNGSLWAISGIHNLTELLIKERVSALNANGWLSDTECEGVAAGRAGSSAAVFLRAPTGGIHQIDLGRETPLDGPHQRRIRGMETTGFYKAGICIGSTGPQNVAEILGQ